MCDQTLGYKQLSALFLPTFSFDNGGPSLSKRRLTWNLGVSFSKMLLYCKIVARHQCLPCVHSVLLQSSLGVCWLCFLWQVQRQMRNSTQNCGHVYASVCIYICTCVSPPPCYGTVTRDPGHSAIMTYEAGLPWQRLGWLVARWGDITAGLCNNLS